MLMYKKLHVWWYTVLSCTCIHAYIQKYINTARPYTYMHARSASLGPSQLGGVGSNRRVPMQHPRQATNQVKVSHPRANVVKPNNHTYTHIYIKHAYTNMDMHTHVRNRHTQTRTTCLIMSTKFLSHIRTYTCTC